MDILVVSLYIPLCSVLARLSCNNSTFGTNLRLGWNSAGDVERNMYNIWRRGNKLRTGIYNDQS